MKNFIIYFLLPVIMFSCNEKHDQLSSEFKAPPAYTKPWVYWYWIDENISKEGITHDLEAMARVGIGEALIGQVSPGGTRGNVEMLSDSWWEMVRHAVREGHRLGVDIGFFNGPGWAQSGGPWIDAAHSMRYVISREVRVTGPGLFRGSIPANIEHFQDIAIQAFPVPKQENRISRIAKLESQPQIPGLSHLMDGDTSTVFLFAKGKERHVPFIVDVFFEEPVEARSVKLFPMNEPFMVKVNLQVPDGNGGFRTVRVFDFDRRRTTLSVGPMRFAPLTISVPATRSDHFRLLFSDLGSQWKAGFREITISSSDVIDHCAEKQLGKMYPDPLPPWDAYLWPDRGEVLPDHAIDPTTIVDLGSHIDKNGMIEWEVPVGEWIILRTGMVPTGMKNAPAPPAATGYECDKMDKAAIRNHFEAYLGNFFREMPAGERKSLKHIIIDSYEAGSQNWSPVMQEAFIKRYGYDPLPWLPVFTGRIVKGRDLSNRFLWDVRRLVADLISENYVGELRRIVNARGLKLWLENYGHWGFPGEFLQYGGHSDAVAGEFWFENSVWDLGPVETRAASSAAHGYGKNVVSAESYTAGFNFRQTPATMKARGDWAFTQGINHSVLHVYIHQPYNDTKVPGVTAWFGMSFQRNNTWFEQSKAWINYMRRCHYMLQQGKHVADVCYFIGEDAPKMTGIRNPELPRGYDYDYISADVIKHRLKVIDGMLVLPDGMSYRVMVLPPEETMRPEVLIKIRELVADGAIIVGSPPKRSPSLADYPNCDKAVAGIVQEMWGDNQQNQEGEIKFQSGYIYNSNSLLEVFERINFSPDVICADMGILWTHRRSDEADIYFISNQHNEAVETNIFFRVEGKEPELWNPDVGKIAKTENYRTAEGGVSVSLKFAPYGSVFVVFRENPGEEADEPVKMELRMTVDVNGSWRVQFPPGWDAPEHITIENLVSWPDYPDEGVRYFSGTVRYKNTFVLEENQIRPGNKLMLELGKVESFAEISLNSHHPDILWKPPYSIDITDFVKPGENVVEIKVTNTWWNRLIGDAKYPEGFPGSNYHKPRTFTTHKAWKAGDKLLPAGLLGPVKIQVYKSIKR